MRTVSVLSAGLLLVAFANAQDSAGKVAMKGPHICCQTCMNVVGKILGKVEGVSEVKADIKSRTVTFTAANEAAAKAGVKAMVEGGFFGSAELGGKPLPIEAAASAKGKKADTVTVKDVHVCCGSCKKAVTALFKDAKVTFDGPGPRRDVTIAGTNLDAGEIVEALRKAGFNGVAKGE